jgi:hypothetical protein
MNTFFTVLKSIGVLLLGYVAVMLVNLPHDRIINGIYPGGAREAVPVTPPAELVSCGILFLAGVAAGVVVYLLGGPRRKVLLLIITGLFLLTDLFAVLGPLANTSLWYRLAVVALVPLEIWVGYAVGKKIRPMNTGAAMLSAR